MALAGLRSVLNDAIAIYLNDATLAGAFVARWCAGSKIETARGVFQVREAEAGAADRGRAASDAMTSGNVRLITERPRHEPEGSGRKRRRVG